MDTNFSKTEKVEVVSQPIATSSRWAPALGPETVDLLKFLNLPDQESRDRLANEALAVLSKCLPPYAPPGRETSLAIGYVQSGKTMSFTNVATLACDNGYAMVIVIAGTSIPLFKQSEERLKNDLRLGTRIDWQWKHLSKPGIDKVQQLEDTLKEWQYSGLAAASRQTLLLTVMKNHAHLRKLNQLLERLDLTKIPVLVIDDEADQAGLNTAVNQAGYSTTYRHLVKLRQNLPHHTYLQYTATPQAPLLINIIDVLSPRTATVLTPGRQYTGGKEFFTGTMPLVRIIPQSDIPSKDNLITEPPQSLQYAVRLFLLGVADAYTSGEPTGNRSMMVHPSHKTIPHSQSTEWVKHIKETWQTLLSQPAENQDRAELVEEFREPYNDLCGTVPGIASFDVLIENLLRAIPRTNVQEINSKQRDGTPQVVWRNYYSHILVGGQAMDRGYTVEGLTVTYMPRGMGVGNADTIQQRARFFGYKRGYLGYCRVFVGDSVRDIFLAYVEHEEDIRNRLSEHQATGAPLSEWKRAFFLDQRLKPTRRNVLSLSYIQDAFINEWYIPLAPQISMDAVESNRKVVRNFLLQTNFVPDQGHVDRTTPQKHLVDTNVRLADVYSKLLPFVRVPYPNDSQRYTGLLLQIERFLEDNPNARCTIYHMSAGMPRVRNAATLEDRGLFQGANPDKNGSVYPGDRNIRSESDLTIQIHNLTVTEDDGTEIADVPALAIWVPKSMSRDWLIQEQSSS